MRADHLSRTPPAGGNLVLIGMPGVGKSTLGVLLAKQTARDFVDTDVVLQARAGRRLQDILDAHGPEGFRRLEEEAVCGLHCTRTVIATGGSVVYGERAMRHLAAAGLVVLLELPLPALEARLANLPTRGVVRVPGQSLADVFAERQPLYARWADVAVACAGLGHEAAVARILTAVAAEGS